MRCGVRCDRSLRVGWLGIDSVHFIGAILLLLRAMINVDALLLLLLWPIPTQRMLLPLQTLLSLWTKSPLSNKQARLMHSNLPSKSWLGPTFQIAIAIMIGSFSLGWSTIFTAGSFHLYYELDKSFICIYISSLLQFLSVDHNKIKLFDWRKHHQCRPKSFCWMGPRLQGHVVVFKIKLDVSNSKVKCMSFTITCDKLII